MPKATISPRTWHARRAARILVEHPEVNALQGPTIWTAAAIVAVACLHSALAVWAAKMAWPWFLAVVRRLVICRLPSPAT